MKVRLALLPVLISVAMTGAFLHHPALAQTGQTASITAYGLRVTMSLDASSYPRNALVRVHLTVRNRAQYPIRLAPHGCDGTFLWANVLGRDGATVDPPPAQYSFGHCVMHLNTLLPGEARTGTWLAVLRGNMIEGNVSILVRNRTVPVSTPRLRLAPHRTPPLRSELLRSPRVALVVPSGNRQSGLYYRDWWACGNGGSLPRQWKVAHGNQVTPLGCAHPSTWHVEAGYLGAPVVTVSYVRG